MDNGRKGKRKRKLSSENDLEDGNAEALSVQIESEMEFGALRGSTILREEKDPIVKTEDASVETEPTTSYKLLGQPTFTETKEINVTLKWIKAAKTFPASLSEENLVRLEEISGFHSLLFDAVKKNVSRWFPVQKAVLPFLLRDINCPPILPPRDLAISAPTGSGKTLCYILPIINSLSDWAVTRCAHALIVAPVQNLVVQIHNEFERFNCFQIPTALLNGSRDMSAEKKELETALVVFATPGRLMEHLFDSLPSFDFSLLRYLVIDEADRMHQTARLEWLEHVENAGKIGKRGYCINDFYEGQHVQKILVSATLSYDVENLQIWGLRYPRLFRASPHAVQELKRKHVESTQVSEDPSVLDEATVLPDSLNHEILVCDAKLKPLAVYKKILGHLNWKRILIFVNNRLASQRLTILLKSLGKGEFDVEEFSSNLFGRRRLKVLKRFEEGTIKVLISSDVLSRGVDVQNVDAVINYNKAQNERNFVHRVGRTARCGKEGRAISVVTFGEKKELEKILSFFDVLEKSETVVFTMNDKDPLLERYKQALETLKTSVIIKHKKVRNHNISKRKVSKGMKK